MRDPKPYLREGQYYIRRRVPLRFASVEPRKFLHIALATDSLTIAKRKAAEVWAQTVEGWEAKLESDDAQGDAKIAAARALAQKRGFRYVDVSETVKLSIEEILSRIESAVDRRGRLDMRMAEAALGLIPQPSITATEAFEEFYKVAGDRLVGKSADQLRRHKAPRLKATRNFVQAVGDKAINDITREDMLAFRTHWLARIAAGEVKAASANKDFTYLTAMWRAVAFAKGFKLELDTGGIAFTSHKGRKGTRPPFSDDWIRTRILAPGALAGLETEARLILLGMINTGYRPSEGAGLRAEEIKLEAKVPHLLIQPNRNRSLKNAHSERYIPLTGVSLEAFRQAAQGFQTYGKNSAALSQIVNDFLDGAGLLETPKHSMYSLRHSFEDRLLVAGIDERIRRDLMGHGLKRERYGKGGDMEHVHSLLSPLAL